MKDYKDLSDYKVYHRFQIASYDLSFDSLIHLSIDDLYEEGPPHYVTSIDIEGIYHFLSRQHESGTMLRYAKDMRYWKESKHS